MNATYGGHAPAGYGKSTLLSQWVQQQPVRSAWLSPDETDNDAARYWRYVLHALSKVGAARFAERAASLIRELPGLSLQSLMDALINELDAAGDAVIRQGDSNRVIAEQLSLSEGTVKVYLSRIYGKLGVTSRTQALLVVEELGLLEDYYTVEQQNSPLSASFTLRIRGCYLFSGDRSDEL